MEILKRLPCGLRFRIMLTNTIEHTQLFIEIKTVIHISLAIRLSKEALE